jgi:hypothetical protein
VGDCRGVTVELGSSPDIVVKKSVKNMLVVAVTAQLRADAGLFGAAELRYNADYSGAIAQLANL